mmetsp:Transcript_53799/g.78885  ORF Transcript_53799/g.78885 Transcript_53799/m.78885 type:complete len:80 (-) Transcript_53799:737-976(-)
MADPPPTRRTQQIKLKCEYTLNRCLPSSNTLPSNSFLTQQIPKQQQECSCAVEKSQCVATCQLRQCVATHFDKIAEQSQ